MLLGLIGLIGLIASFFTIIFAYGRNTYSLSRAGYFPQFLSVTHRTRKTPHVALIAGAVVGYAVSCWSSGTSAGRKATLGAQVVAAVLNMAVFAAVIAYALQCLSFVLLRQEAAEHRASVPQPVGRRRRIRRRRHRARRARVDLPQRGLPARRVRRRDLLRARLLYFAIAGRHRLVLSPEEEFALTQGEQGVPGQAAGTRRAPRAGGDPGRRGRPDRRPPPAG